MRLRLKIRGAGRDRFLPGNNANPNASVKHLEIVRHKYAVKPGEVRNPYGRNGKPKRERIWSEEVHKAMESRKLTEICRETAEEVMDVVKTILHSDTSADTAKLTAAQMILDRAYGKATQTQVNAQVNADGKTTEIDDSELQRRISDALEAVNRVAASGTRKTEEGSGEKRPLNLRKFN
jgi:hypothetical protein